MDENQLRQAVCDAGYQLWLRRLIWGDGGFISAELNKRRFIVSTQGQRKALMKPDEVKCVDLAGADMLSADPALPDEIWRPHRLAYQSAAYIEATSSGYGRQIHATVLATPPNVMALHTLDPDADFLSITGQKDLPVVAYNDDTALQRALISGPLFIIRGEGVMAADSSVEQCLSMLEQLEHYASIELAIGGE